MTSSAPAFQNIDTDAAVKAARGSRQRVWLTHLLDTTEGLNPGAFTTGKWGGSTYSAIRSFIRGLEALGYVIETQELGPLGGRREVITDYVPGRAAAIELLYSRAWARRHYGWALMPVNADDARRIADTLTERDLKAMRVLSEDWTENLETLVETVRALD